MDTITVEENREELVKRFSVYDYVVFSIMLAISAAIGIFYAFKKDQRTTKEILMGGKSMSVFPVAMSVLASFMSAITLLGTPAEMYTYGTQYWMIILGYLFLMPAAAYFYLPIFYNLEVTSAYEYLERRFNKYVRTLASLAFSLQMIFYMAIVLYAPSLALSQVTGIKVWTSVLSIGIVCTFYTTIGGIKAVVWTDLFQVLMMFAAMLAIVIKGVYDEGGIETVWQKNVEGQRIEFFNFDPNPLTRHTVWSLTIGGFFTWLAVYGANQAMIQRYLSLPTLKKAQAVIWINLPGLSFLLTITCLAGLAIFAKYKDCDPLKSKQVSTKDQLFPLFVMDVLGDVSGVPGLFVAGIFSGALSTVSSGVNSLAAVALEDIIKVYVKPDISEVWAARLTKIFALIFGAIAILLVFVAQELGDVLPAALSLFGMIGGPVLGLFTLGMFFPWPNAVGAIIGLVSGLVMAFWIGFGYFIYKPPIPKPPISIAGCHFNLTSILTNITATTTTVAPMKAGYIELYRMSYMWYSAIGCSTVIIVGIIISFLTGPNKGADMDPKLFSPFFETIFFWLPANIRKMLRFGVSEKDSWDNNKPALRGSNFNLPTLEPSKEKRDGVDFKQGIANLSYTPSVHDFNSSFSLQHRNNNMANSEKEKY